MVLVSRLKCGVLRPEPCSVQRSNQSSAKSYHEALRTGASGIGENTVIRLASAFLTLMLCAVSTTPIELEDISLTLVGGAGRSGERGSKCLATMFPAPSLTVRGVESSSLGSRASARNARSRADASEVRIPTGPEPRPHLNLLVGDSETTAAGCFLVFSAFGYRFSVLSNHAEVGVPVSPLARFCKAVGALSEMGWIATTFCLSRRLRRMTRNIRPTIARRTTGTATPIAMVRLDEDDESATSNGSVSSLKPLARAQQSDLGDHHGVKASLLPTKPCGDGEKSG